MPLAIWVDDWQMQCCGESFSVGGCRPLDVAGGRFGGVRRRRGWRMCQGDRFP
ncbi:DUF6578 domain-containing protein [Streptomyces sp. DH12]|uniref:DUF6578 domain-containing protein n=1 Tax=Streptomyces sp. DH12 TaxID=2857010 RepID=UPI0027D309B5|nr:DUF6578 domain-containing protein [Streptomyces sp. DH12]